ncbi:SusC/RagA family TonB-linked outer membrane protein [Sphingobacterium gobiense]|uniref:SusC/RagA family TonB-linked outer membrane protein n=1 Tax=Sphingobacterium gobiense TaxID=1382456 RepID=A0A2S9JIN2_9SPHI|nr:TonB-dependent receptor [Sphingobacterium gobiense]PRD52749.1 SusC/RagA family TonB-linked outer membrane protein [Sphingobacterium gobiense]
MKQKNKLLGMMKKYVIILLLMIPLTSIAQQAAVIRGTVMDSRGQPLAGVTVETVDSVKNQRFQASTNANGIFFLGGLSSDRSYDVLFSRLGYERYVERRFLVRAGDNNSLLVRMSAGSEKVDEVVVVGYGTQRRALVTSAISKMNVDESTLRPVSSPAQLLDGRIAGVSTATGSGNLGSGERVSIRGISSLSASNEPLYVIDGVPITNSNSNLYNFGESMSSLATLNIADIESVEILKDAASAAIYGSRATNGVVVITTRSGKEGRADIRLNVNGGMTKFPYLNKIKIADSELYVRSMNEGIANYNEQYGLQIGDSGYKMPISNPFGNLPDTDWMDIITQTGSFFTVDAAVSGGTKKMKNYFAVAYTTQEGVIKTNAMDKINLRGKMNYEVAPWLEIGTNNSGNYVRNNQIPGATLGTTIIGRAIQQRPFDRPYKPNGDYYVGGTNELVYHNPMQILNEQTAYIEDLRYLGNFYATLKWKDKLSWKSSFNADVTQTYDHTYYNENHPYGVGIGRLLDRNRLIRNYLFENVLTYNEKFGDFSLNAIAGHSFQKIDTRTTYIDARGFPSPSFVVASAAAETMSSSGRGIYTLESYFSRATLSYLDRYILTGTLRTDGSSRFHRDNRWGWFPSISAGWNISEEEFMRGSGTDLKFRMSYGRTGNQDGLGSYVYQALMEGGFNYGANSGIAVTTFGNRDLTWEKAGQYDIGFDIGLFNGRVNMMLDWYQKNTTDLIYSMPVHATTGVTSITTNIGSMRNRGGEFTLNTHFNFGQFQWLSQFNIATNKNKITSLIGDDEPISIGGNRALQVGQEIGAYYLFKMEGIYQYDGEVPKEQYDIGIRAGDVKWKDVDGNGIINDNDRVVMGSSNPDFFGGWNNTFRYKGVSLDVFLSYGYGNDVFAQWQGEVARLGHNSAIMTEHAENRWTGPGSTNKFPRALNGDINNVRNSDRWLEDGSFIRLRTLMLSYNFPTQMLSRYHIKGLRAFLQGDNLFLITNYPGWDPQVSNNMDPRFFSVDTFNVPQPRTFTVGLNANF